MGEVLIRQDATHLCQISCKKQPHTDPGSIPWAKRDGLGGGVPEKNASTTPKDAGQKLRAPQKWVRGVGAIYGLKRQIIAQNDVQWRLFIPILERVCEEYPTLKELVDLTFIAEQMHLKRSKTKSILKSLL